MWHEQRLCGLADFNQTADCSSYCAQQPRILRSIDLATAAKQCKGLVPRSEKHLLTLRVKLGIFYDLALGGCLPVLLIELILREAHKLEGYILIISVCCVALSASTWIVTSNVLNGYSPEDLTHNGPSACAGLVPTAVCYADDWFYKSSAASEGTGLAIIIFSLIVQACIVLDKLRVFSHGDHGSRRNSFEIVRDKFFGGAESQGKTQTMEASRNRLTRLRSSNSRKNAQIVGKLIIVAAEIALLCLTLRQLKDYARIFGAGKVDDYVAVNKTSWKLGQIIVSAVSLFDEQVANLTLGRSRLRASSGRIHLGLLP